MTRTNCALLVFELSEVKSVRPSKTYFEQISVEAVKKLVPAPAIARGVETVSLDAPDQGGPAEEGWRELAERVQAESNPDVMVGLIQQLTAKLDEERMRRPERSASQPSRGRS